jgi:small subunit ribosomal protein S4e
MAKKGGTRHTKRIAVPKHIPLSNKKEKMFLMTAHPGPHGKNMSYSLGVLMRDVLGITKTAAEARMVIREGGVLVDGKARREIKFPVGLMDSVSIPKAGLLYRMVVDKKGRLKPADSTNGKSKICKVVGKRTDKGGKLKITLHDGRNMPSDNNIKVGDSVIISVPEQKLSKVLKLEAGAKCLVTEGKHAGTVAALESLIERKDSWTEAKLKGDVEFITVAKYLFVIDGSYEGA